MAAPPQGLGAHHGDVGALGGGVEQPGQGPAELVALLEQRFPGAAYARALELTTPDERTLASGTAVTWTSNTGR